MIKIGFLHFTNAPTENALPSNIDPPTFERCSKTVAFFHDESTFMANEDQPTQWGMKGEKMIKPKSKGAGIMVSDFVDKHNGFLDLTAEEYEVAKASNPNARMYACAFLEYGENREGYWTRDRFIDQMEEAVQIAEIKYPKVEGWHHVWVFDHSSCHAAMANDALDVSKMNVKHTEDHEGYSVEWSESENAFYSWWKQSGKGHEDGFGRKRFIDCRNECTANERDVGRTC